MPKLVIRQIIETKILYLRGEKVILDKDLADLYQVQPIRLREQVKRNHTRFPKDFMFQLNNNEIDFMVSQNAIPSRQYLGGHKPYAFTEQGVVMLSSVLNSERAIRVNIAIMRAFVKLRQILNSHKDLALKMEESEKKYDAQFKVVFEAIRQLMREDEKPKKSIGFHAR